MGIKSDIIGELIDRAQKGLLDMSQTARMDRAKEQGFDTDTVFFHGTREDANKIIEEGFNTSDRALDTSIPNPRGDNIGTFFAQNRNHSKDFGQNIIPVHLALKNPKKFKTQNEFREFIKANSGQTADIRDAEGFIEKEGVFENNARRVLEEQGHDGVIIERPNFSRSKAADKPWAIAFKPEQIRSTAAAFDPAQSTSSNLLSSSPIAAIGGAGLASQTEQGQQTIDSILEELRQRGAQGLVTPQEALRLGGGDVGGIEARSIRAPSIFGPILDAIDRVSDVELPIIGKPLEGVGEFVRDIGFKNTTAGKLKKAAGAALDLI